MGKKKKPTIGFWHQMGLYMGHSFGEVDQVRKLVWDNNIGWSGTQTASGDIVIDQPNLFGGEKKEGGIVGTLTVRMGEATQEPHPYLVGQVPGPWPAARGLFTTLFVGRVGAMTPYVKPMSVQMSRWTKGWKTPVWQPSLVKVGEGMNAAHIVYEVMTDPDATLGLGIDGIDETSFLAAAQLFYNEDMGLCLKWRQSEPVQNFVQQVCDHVAAQWAIDPRTNKVTLTPFRDNYDPDTLPLLDESNIVEMQSWEQPLIDNATNEITVVGRDCETNKDISCTYQNLAAVQAQGRVINEKREYPGLWNLEQCARVAARETHVSTSLLARIKLKVKQTEWGVKRGDVRALSWSRRGVVRMPVRVIDVDEGTPTDSTILLTLVQDVFGLPATTYIVPSDSVWTPPDTTPVPVAAQRVYEATYRDLAGNLSTADLDALTDDVGFLVALGARPTGVAYGYDLHTRVGSAAFVEVSSGDFSATGFLQANLGPTDVSIVIENGRSLDLVVVGSEAMIGDEMMRVDAIDPLSGAATLGRGCADTVPSAHLAGDRVWFTDTYNGADPTEYIDGETVDAKLLTRTAEGTLDPGSAPTVSITMDQRQARPYPPGQLRLNALAYPAELYGALTASWAHRDRLLQADQLVDHEAASIGPEPGTTYTVRWYIDNVLAQTFAGIAGTSSTPWTPPVGTGGKGVRVEVQSIRAGLNSWQFAQHTFLYRANLVTEAGDRIVTEEGDPITLE